MQVVSLLQFPWSYMQHRSWHLISDSFSYSFLFKAAFKASVRIHHANGGDAVRHGEKKSALQTCTALYVCVGMIASFPPFMFGRNG